MKKTISRREMLKTMAMGAAGLALAACTTSQATTQAPTTAAPTAVVTPAPKAVTLTWWQAPIWRYGPDNTTVLSAGSDAVAVDLANRFMAKYPYIKVNMELIPWDQWTAKTVTGFASGQVANVVYGSMNASRITAGLFEPLDDYLTSDITDNWLTGMKEALTYSGRVYGIPWEVNPDFTVLDQTSLEKYGAGDIITQVGTDRSGVTFDLLMQEGLKYGDKKTRYMWGVPMDHGSILYWMFGSWMEGWGVKCWSDDETRWQAADNPNAEAALQWLLDAANSGVMPPAKSLPKWSDIDNLQWSGNLGGRIQWAGDIAELATAQAAGQASADFKIFFAAFPHKADVPAFGASMSPIAYDVGKTNDPAIRQASFTMANWLASDDSNQVMILVNGGFPACKSGLKIVSSHPLLKDPNINWTINTHMTKYAPEITGSNFQPIFNARSSDIFGQLQPDQYNYFVQQMQSMMLGQKTPAALLKEIATTINTALGVKV
jgi:ABC-type glycerol-3-phosphate transport system substrate-binding protein